MIFSRVYLAYHATDAGPIATHHDEHVLGHETDTMISLHDFNVREALAVRAYFVLALHDAHTAFTQYTVSLHPCRLVQ